MSYKVGGFHVLVFEYEVITSDGQIIKLAEPKNSEIFEMVHGTFGTVGFISQLKFKLISAQPLFVFNITLLILSKKYQAAIKTIFKKKTSILSMALFFLIKIYLSIVISSQRLRILILMIGIKFIGNQLNSGRRLSNHPRLFFPLWRWLPLDRQKLWSRNPIIRFLFGRYFLPSTKMLELSKKITPLLKNTKPDVVIDIFSPISRLTKFWKFYLRKFKYFPVWVVPYYIEKPYPWIIQNIFAKSKTSFILI